MNNNNIYAELLNGFEFEKLEKKLFEIPFREMADVLDQLAYNQVADENNLLVYTFLTTIIAKKETSEIHYLTSQIMGQTLNHIDGAEKIGLYHGLKAAELNHEDVSILEYLLYFNHIPEKVLDDNTAIAFAQKVIEKYPNSLAAKMTLGKLNFRPE